MSSKENIYIIQVNKNKYVVPVPKFQYPSQNSVSQVGDSNTVFKTKWGRAGATGTRTSHNQTETQTPAWVLNPTLCSFWCILWAGNQIFQKYAFVLTKQWSSLRGSSAWGSGSSLRIPWCQLRFHNPRNCWGSRDKSYLGCQNCYHKVCQRNSLRLNLEFKKAGSL